MRRAIVVASAVAWVVLSGFAHAQDDPVGEARSLLGAKKYDEVDTALAELLSVQNPPPEALRLSLDAALASGRVVTAQKRITSLLRASQTPELLHLGGRIADNVGDANLAVTRYFAYARAVDRPTDELKEALAYLARSGSYPDEYKRYVERFGANGTSWSLGCGLFGRLMENGYADKAIDILGFMAGRFSNPDAVTHLHWTLYDLAARKTLYVEREKSATPLDAMLKGEAFHTGYLQEVYRYLKDGLSPRQRVDYAFEIQSRNRGPLGWGILEYFGSMRDLGSDEEKVEAGRKFLGLESKYRDDPDPWRYSEYMRIIEESPQVFNIRGQELVPPDDIQRKFETLKGKLDAWSLREHLRKTAHHYLGDQAARRTFYDRHLDILYPDRCHELVDLGGGGNLDEIVAGATRDKGVKDAIDIRANLMDWYNRRQNADGLFKATRDYMNAFPGSFSRDHVYNNAINTGVLSVDRKVEMMREVAEKGGYSGPMRDLIDRIAKDTGNQNARALVEDAGFKKLVEEFNRKKAGTDLAARTHVALHNIRTNRGSPDPAVADAVREFLKGYRRRIPGNWDQTKTIDDVVAYGIFDKHRDHVWDNGDRLAEWAEMWAPHLDIGYGWEMMARRVREHGRRGNLYNIAKHLLPQIKGKQKGWPGLWGEIRQASNPRSDPKPLFARVYDQMGHDNAIAYLFDQQQSIDMQLIMDEIGKIAARPGFRFSSRDQAVWLIRTLYERTGARSKPPVELVRSLWAYLVADEERSGHYDTGAEAQVHGLYTRAGRGPEAARHLEDYLKRVRRRRDDQQVAALASVVPLIPREGGAKVEPGGRRHAILKILKPAYERCSRDEWPGLGVHGSVLQEVYEMLGSLKGREKDEALEFLRLQVKVLASGAGYAGQGSTLFPAVAHKIREDVDAKAWDEVGLLTRYLAGQFGRTTDWGRTLNEHILPLVEKLDKAGAHELAFVFVSEIEKRNRPGADVAKKLALIKAQEARSIPEVLAVDKSDPTYDMHLAAQALALGNEGRAWELTSPKLDILPKSWMNLDPAYVAWCVEQLRKQKRLKEALDFSFTVLLREFDLDPEIVARVSLTKGDIYRDMQNYQAARIEYDGLQKNRRYNRTEAGSKAKYRLIDLLILTKDYAAAEGLLERLVDSDDLMTQAEAYYLYARMAFDQAEYTQAKDHLTEVFKRRHDHVEGRLLEGELKLLLPRGLASTEVLVGNPQLSTIAIPGRPLVLKLHDSNLSIARGGADIPVVVRTSRGGDVENVRLFPNTGDKYLFTGTISTSLGKAKPNDLLLQLVGDDTVSYVIDPDFQKANDLDYAPKLLAVKSAARLTASAGEILSEEEAEKREVERRLRGAGRLESRRFAGRQGTTVRPGSPIYVQVTDLDRDRGDERDNIPVSLTTTSGDALKGFQLTETGAHTGVFRGKVPTGIPFPKASASDTEEGKDTSVLINSKKRGLWTSLADAQAPKWVEADTMSSHAVSSVSIAMPEPGNVKRIVLLGLLADQYDILASLPETLTGGMGLKGEYYGTISLRTLKATRLDPQINFEWNGGQRPHRLVAGSNFSMRWTGSVESRYSETYTFHTISDDGVRLWIDGKKIVENWTNHGATENTGQARLTAGKRHDVKIEFFQGQGPGCIKLLWSSPSQKREVIPASRLRPYPGQFEAEKAKGKIERSDSGFTAVLETPERLRKVRWVFDEFEGNSISASEIAVTNADGGEVLPVEVDFSAGAANRTLEVAPGDYIEITYEDEKRLREDVPVLHARLDASYFNGTVMLANEVITQRDGNRSIHYQPAMRCRRGDQLMIVAEDYDEDLTDDRDTLRVAVETSAGERLALKALETFPNGTEEQQKHSGVFVAILRIGEKTDRDEIRVSPGDTVTASYLDKENTRPGIPFERTASVEEAGKGAPELLVYRTNVKLVEDTSEKAKLKIRRMEMRGRDAEGMVVYKEQIASVHPRYDPDAAEGEPEPAGAVDEGEIIVSVNAPLLFELSYPKMALNSGSVVEVRAVAESELRAAKKENRKPKPLKVPMYINDITGLARDMGYEIVLRTNDYRDTEAMLADGRFAGIMRLQIGSPGDPVDDLVVAGVREFEQPAETAKEGYGSRVPTMMVAGSDTVHISVKDVETGETVTTDVRLLSDARLELLESTYTAANPAIHLGGKFFVRLTDPDHDFTDDRDAVDLRVAAASGDDYTLRLSETLPHSGVFTGSLKPEHLQEGPGAAARPDKADGAFSVRFGDHVTFTYSDGTSLASREPVDVVEKGLVHHGFDGELASFTKRFKDPEMAVKTRFLMAEALFEMAKEHRKLEQAEKADEEIGKGKRILEEAMRDYPDTGLVAQGEFLLANLAQELKKHQEAIGRYSNIISNWPESEYAARSQFKKAICLEKMGNYDQACEEYVTLTYIYSDSTLVADATVRLGNYYYKRKTYRVAGRIFLRFQQKHPAHRLAAPSLFLAGQCQMKLEEYKEAARLFSSLIDEYVDDKKVRSEAMYWMADAYFKDGQYAKAYQNFKKLTWDYPETKWAKIARGRLTDETLARFDEE